MEDQIREAAYYKWLEAGCPSNGEANRFWVEAEEDILRQNREIVDKTHCPTASQRLPA